MATAGGAQHSLVLTNDGVFSFGRNDSGQLGCTAKVSKDDWGSSENTPMEVKNYLFFSFSFLFSYLDLTFFFLHLPDKPWSQVSSLLPAGACLHFLFAMGWSFPLLVHFHRTSHLVPGTISHTARKCKDRLGTPVSSPIPRTNRCFPFGENRLAGVSAPRLRQPGEGGLRHQPLPRHHGQARALHVRPES